MSFLNMIIPLCLYSNATNSYISLPDENYSCKQTIGDKELKLTFYVINPDLKPNPTYTDLFCVETDGNNIKKISDLYDPFNIDIKCLNFLAWIEATPNTTRLYVWEKDDNILITLNKDIPSGYKYYKIPFIHVLTHPKDKYNNFKVDNQNNPIFTFQNSKGKCIPDTNSKLTLGECLVLYNKNLNSDYKNVYPNLLNYIDKKYNYTEPSKAIDYLGYLSLLLFILSMAIILFYKMNFRKNK